LGTVRKIFLTNRDRYDGVRSTDIIMRSEDFSGEVVVLIHSRPFYSGTLDCH
jgi:hypothetical protein